jgi:competence protein ComEC
MFVKPINRRQTTFRFCSDQAEVGSQNIAHRFLCFLTFIFIFLFSVFCLSSEALAKEDPLSSVFCQDSQLKIHFIDVGEGDSIFVQTPKGKTVLVDAGNLISGFKVVEYLKKNGIDYLDYLIFTHPHSDHIGGAFFILQMMDVGNVYDNGQSLIEVSESQDLYRWYDELVRRNNKYKLLSAGDEFFLDGVNFSVLWPAELPITSDFNTNSLVLMVKYKNFKCLLTGDLIASAESELLKKGIDLEADLLKVGHHGSSDVMGQEFLEAVSPDIAVISINKDNIRGYPSQEVLKKLQKVCSGVCRTDRDGDVIVKVDDGGKVVVERGKKIKF